MPAGGTQADAPRTTCNESAAAKMPAKRLHPDRPQTGAERIRRYRERKKAETEPVAQAEPEQQLSVDDCLGVLGIKPVEWSAAGPGRRAYLLHRALELLRRKQPDERAAMLAAATALTN